MRWCYEKGFAPRHSRWREIDPGYIVFGQRRDGRSAWRQLRGRALEDVLGRALVRELFHHRRALGVDGHLVGHWRRPRELQPTLVLEVRAGDLPLAELIDVNADGRVDAAYLLDPRG